MEEQEFTAEAKINLGLEILRRREDGYHELNTIFLRVKQPHDMLHVQPASTFKLTSTDPDLLVGESNLVYRAFKLFSEATSSPMLNLHVRLQKNIPTGAGLGGGSSNAAAALRICNQFSDSKLSNAELHRVARALGADVPFFLLHDHVAIGSGIGDILVPFDLQIPCSIVIAKLPGISVNTKEAYMGLSIDSNRTPTSFSTVLGGELTIEKARKYLRNDFEKSVFALQPELSNLKARLIKFGAGFALMTGSGSAIFGLFESSTRAQSAMTFLQEDGMLAYLNEPTS
jgi:4-diphosphocytidyl-2-C-methyl-D-erythritol kinase